MLTDSDKLTIRDIVREENDHLEVKIDKILKIVTSSNQEHTITKAKVKKLEIRVTKIEKKVKIKSPSESVIFS